MHDTRGAWLSVLRVHGPQFVEPDRLIWGGPAVGSLTVSRKQGEGLKIVYADRAGPSNVSSSWSVDLISGNLQALKPGRYLDAWGAGTPQRPMAAPTLDFSLGSTVFMPSQSEFEIFELEFDAAGQVSRLAMDFVVRGIGDFTPSAGSVRINSARPLPP
jgi:hypothetical protein